MVTLIVVPMDLEMSSWCCNNELLFVDCVIVCQSKTIIQRNRNWLRNCVFDNATILDIVSPGSILQQKLRVKLF